MSKKHRNAVEHFDLLMSLIITKLPVTNEITNFIGNNNIFMKSLIFSNLFNHFGEELVDHLRSRPDYYPAMMEVDG